MSGAGSAASHMSSRRSHRTPSAVSQAACQPAYASAPSRIGSIGRHYALGAQNDLECGAETRTGGELEPALDARSTRANVLEPLTGRRRLAVEPLAVVTDRHEALSVDPLGDHDLRAGRVRVLANVSEALLDDAE